MANTENFIRSMNRWFPTSGSDDPLARSHHRWSGKLGVWLLLGGLAVVFGLVSLLVMTTPLASNELGLLGGLKVTTDDDTQVFVGDLRVGSGTVNISWNDLLGSGDRPPLAVPVDSTSVDLVAKMIGGPAAEIVWASEGPSGAHRGARDANYSFGEVLLRRGDGDLDHVLLVTCEFPDAESPGTDNAWNKLFIPVRARKAGDAAVGYFPRPGMQGGGTVNRGMIPSRRDHATFEIKLEIDAGVPKRDLPAGVATQLAKEGLWQPSPSAEVEPANP